MQRLVGHAAACKTVYLDFICTCKERESGRDGVRVRKREREGRTEKREGRRGREGGESEGGREGGGGGKYCQLIIQNM